MAACSTQVALQPLPMTPHEHRTRGAHDIKPDHYTEISGQPKQARLACTSRHCSDYRHFFVARRRRQGPSVRPKGRWQFCLLYKLPYRLLLVCGVLLARWSFLLYGPFYAFPQFAYELPAKNPRIENNSETAEDNDTQGSARNNLRRHFGEPIGYEKCKRNLGEIFLYGYIDAVAEARVCLIQPQRSTVDNALRCLGWRLFTYMGFTKKSLVVNLQWYPVGWLFFETHRLTLGIPSPQVAQDIITATLASTLVGLNIKGWG